MRGGARVGGARVGGAGRVGVAEMRGGGALAELAVLAEHRQQVLLQAHHQRVDPGVEQHVGALEAHLRRVARGEVLHVDGRGDHGAGDAQALGDVALHLGAEHQVGRRRSDRRLHVEVVVAHQRGDAVQRRGLAQLAGELSAVAAQAHHLEAQLPCRDPGGGDGVGGVAEHEHALAGEVGGVHRARVPGQVGVALRVGGGPRRVEAGEARHLGDELAGGAHADRDRAGLRLAELSLQPAGGDPCGLGVEHDVEVGSAQAGEVGGAGAEGRAHVDGDADALQQRGDLAHVVAVAEAEGGGAEQVAGRRAALA